MQKPSAELKFGRPLWKHQAEDLDFNFRRPEWAFLWDMGTGKTTETIAWLRCKYTLHQEILPTIIIAPLSTLYNWEHEFKENAPKVAEFVHVLTKKNKHKIHSASAAGKRIFITNYETLDSPTVLPELHKRGFKIVVCDEMHKLKNPKSKRGKILWEMSDKATYRVGLTGTPILNTLLDVWAQWRFLDKGQTFGVNYHSQFKRKYFYDKNAGMPAQKYFPDWKPSPGAEIEIRQKMYEKASRVMKADCLSLPPLVKTKLYCELSKEQRAAYDAMKDDFIAYVDGEACVANIAITKLLRMLQIVSGFYHTDRDEEYSFKENPRLDLVKETLEGLITTNKVILWCVYKQNYVDLERICKELKTEPVFIIGGMDADKKQAAIHAFQTDDKTRVMIAHPKAGGVGVNLTAAAYAVYYSRTHSLEERLQSEARNHRGGSEIHDKITLIDILSTDTIEDKVLAIVDKKEDMAEKILDIRNMLR